MESMYTSMDKALCCPENFEKADIIWPDIIMAYTA